MKITKGKLRQIIREELLREYDIGGMGLGFDPDDSLSANRLSPEDAKRRAKTVVKTVVQILDPTALTTVADPDYRDQLEKARLKASNTPSASTVGIYLLTLAAAAPLVGKVIGIPARAAKAALGAGTKTGKSRAVLSSLADKAIKNASDQPQKVVRAASAKSVGSLPKGVTSSSKPIKWTAPTSGETTVGFHGTASTNLKSLQKHGLDNRVGRESGAGLDAVAQGVMAPTTANWTASIQSSLGWARSATRNAGKGKPVVLAFDTGEKMVAGGYNAYKGFVTMLEDGTRLILKPKASQSKRFEEMSDALAKKLGLPQFGSRPLNTSQLDEFFDVVRVEKPGAPKMSKEAVTEFVATSSRSLGKPSKIAGKQKTQGAGVIGVGEKPTQFPRSSAESIPPEKIKVTFDGGENWFKLTDLNIP